jgi:hypothetical protein
MLPKSAKGRFGFLSPLGVKEVSLGDPVDFYNTLNRGLWVGGSFQHIGPNLSKASAAVLYKAGMQIIRDVWNLD